MTLTPTLRAGQAPRDRYAGALLGFAVGDALGTTLEFRAPGTFRPIDDMVGGGPFGLAPGQWTDDTSMAMCLAESLLEFLNLSALARNSWPFASSENANTTPRERPSPEWRVNCSGAWLNSGSLSPGPTLQQSPNRCASRVRNLADSL